MKKIILLVFLFFSLFFLCGCDNQKSYILFNKHPFAEETMTSTTNVFAPNERIYYLVTTPKPVESKRLLIQVVKLGSQERLGYELVWSKQVKIRDEQIYYYTNYLVFSEKGAYSMRVYSKDNPEKILSTNDFYVK